MGKPNRIVDSLLVISYQGGNKKALDLLVRRWNTKLCAHAYRYLDDWELAKDVTQDTWSTVLAKIHMLRDSNSFGSWAMTIAGRKALDTIAKQTKRKKEVKPQFWENHETVSEPLITKEAQINGILKVMATLPLEQKMVLRLFYLEEYSLKEISAITNTSVSTVKTRLFRAREKIKEELKIRKDEKRD
ncbi:sigma-70 family RNA polymerase sigma factor [Flavobacteriaceae bacterium GF1]